MVVCKQTLPLGDYMNKHQVAGTEKVGGIQIWFVGEVSDAGRQQPEVPLFRESISWPL